MNTNDQGISLELLKAKIKKYLELDNVSILAGAGASWHLGTPIIRKIPDAISKTCKREIDYYFKSGSEPSLEEFLNCLQSDRYLHLLKGDETKDIDNCIYTIQKWLFKACDSEKTTIQPSIVDEQKRLLEKNRYHYHEVLIKKLLQRPNNLRRVNLFTTNYDMAFDYALDDLGVHYINGFMGVHNRCFRPEVYDYDLYYPGQSVSGKVHRAEKVLRYYKLHGSLSWVASQPCSKNTYGISEVSLNSDFELDESKELLIYPCATKKAFTLDLPYSELFRQFSQLINRPQSVLICIGYSFFDEHINDIIKQALSNPSFTLIIANFSPQSSESHSEMKEIKKVKFPFIIKSRKSVEEEYLGKGPIEELQCLNDPRIIVLPQDNTDCSTFIGFVKNIMPDIYEEEEKELLLKTITALHGEKEKK